MVCILIGSMLLFSRVNTTILNWLLAASKIRVQLPTYMLCILKKTMIMNESINRI